MNPIPVPPDQKEDNDEKGDEHNTPYTSRAYRYVAYALEHGPVAFGVIVRHIDREKDTQHEGIDHWEDNPSDCVDLPGDQPPVVHVALLVVGIRLKAVVSGEMEEVKRYSPRKLHAQVDEILLVDVLPLPEHCIHRELRDSGIDVDREEN